MLSGIFEIFFIRGIKTFRKLERKIRLAMGN